MKEFVIIFLIKRIKFKKTDFVGILVASYAWVEYSICFRQSMLNVFVVLVIAL